MDSKRDKLEKILEIPNEIKEEIDEALKIDETKLSENLKDGISYEKKIIDGIYTIGQKIIKIEDEIREKTEELHNYYLFEFNRKLPVTEIKVKIENNKDMRPLKKKLAYLNNMLKYYELVRDLLQQRNYNIKLILDYSKFKAGIGL